MRFTFLGTSAANAYPEAFCQCANCRNARRAGGKSLRKRSALLVNADLLIDLGPDIMVAAQMHQVALTDVQYCLQTHPHADHLDLSHLLSRSPGFGVVGAPQLHFYASPATLERASQTFERDLWGFGLFEAHLAAELNLEVNPIQPLQPLQIGPYAVVAIPANHALECQALLYAVEAGGRRLFYATDTAALPETTWLAFHAQRLQFDAVILDHTYGANETGEDHLSAHQVIAHMQRMREEGILKPGGRVFATHIAHQGNPIHPELEEFARQHGYEVAYDGLQVEI